MPVASTAQFNGIKLQRPIFASQNRIRLGRCTIRAVGHGVLRKWKKATIQRVASILPGQSLNRSLKSAAEVVFEDRNELLNSRPLDAPSGSAPTLHDIKLSWLQ